jgi:hypothetical protein
MLRFQTERKGRTYLFERLQSMRIQHENVESGSCATSETVLPSSQRSEQSQKSRDLEHQIDQLKELMNTGLLLCGFPLQLTYKDSVHAAASILGQMYHDHTPQVFA